MTEYYSYITKDNDRWDLIANKFQNLKAAFTINTKLGLRRRVLEVEQKKPMPLNSKAIFICHPKQYLTTNEQKSNAL